MVRKYSSGQPNIFTICRVYRALSPYCLSIQEYTTLVQYTVKHIECCFSTAVQSRLNTQRRHNIVLFGGNETFEVLLKIRHAVRKTEQFGSCVGIINIDLA
jgi:hypothetical protein